MKKFYLKSVALCALLGLSANAFAGDIYVSAKGSDSNDGSSATSALATLNAAVAKASSGDVIKINGKVKVSETVTLKNFGDLTIEGASSDDDQLDGQNKVQILNVTGTNLTLRNLTLRRGSVQGDKNARGGAMWCRGKVVTIDHCVFSKNLTPYKPEDNGGAIFVTDGTLKVSNSEFNSNTAYRGGAIEAQVTTLDIYNTTFSKNMTFSADDSRTGQANGGALAIGKCTANISYSTLEGNASAGRGGAIKIWSDGNKTGQSVTFQSCAILSNEGGGPGGAFSLDLDDKSDFKLNVFSTTVYGNSTTGAGGVLCIENARSTENQQINFVNCTITGNSTAANAGNVGGFMTHGGSTIKAKLNIINTILEGNTTSQGYSDARFARNADPDYVTVANSIIGNAFKDKNDGDLKNVTNSEINTTGQAKENPLTAGLVSEPVEGCLPLKADSKCLTMGNVELAAQYGCTVDQKGQKWTKPYIGAVQLVDGENIPDPIATGIKNVNAGNANVQKADNAYYTLQGIRVSKPSKGIFIHNGKKIIIR